MTVKLDNEEWQRLDGKFQLVYDRLNPLCEQVRENTTNISWLKWGVVTVIGSLIVLALGVVASTGG